MIYLTAGESHGPELTGVIEGFPAGLTLSVEKINEKLHARQCGYGRGYRQKIEKDEVKITSGVRHGVTLGSPITLRIANIDHKHWGEVMKPVGAPDPEVAMREVKKPRPGHADLVGGMKYGHRDLRNVLERSSARETAMRVAIGAVCTQLLNQLGITIAGYVRSIGPIEADGERLLSPDEIEQAIALNDLRIVDQDKVEQIHEFIDRMKKAGDTLGGVVRVVASNVPAGLGSYISWNEKLDAKIAAAVLGINAFKGVSFGDGFELSRRSGSNVMDQIYWDKEQGWYRSSDHLGGFEGGMTNGMPIIVNAAMKPIPTLYKPLHSVAIDSKEEQKASIERSDVTAIVPASLIIESVVAIELCKIILDTFDCSRFHRLKKQYNDYCEELKNY
ncbi:chorismate synthase [Sporolactobacillus terrae]|uniref:Chorismate synthase n=1 Tax=Sporolactobacillus terrae TaxID=269673 RepID=A0ABX5Q461_9BACL|nr:chorismate synthase [Sporolactobacillus terrae]QAA21417.1 chorismate synthase [Sporolactobacillus terrae]QAA24389.1 chorismate synthase [Sporolactobacillus terrae]UAK16214.1 chorismate synthase [Sporolactobacillus terrae]